MSLDWMKPIDPAGRAKQEKYQAGKAAVIESLRTGREVPMATAAPPAKQAPPELTTAYNQFLRRQLTDPLSGRALQESVELLRSAYQGQGVPFPTDPPPASGEASQ